MSSINLPIYLKTQKKFKNNCLGEFGHGYNGISHGWPTENSSLNNEQTFHFSFDFSFILGFSNGYASLTVFLFLTSSFWRQ